MTDEFLFLGVHADSRIPTAAKLPALLGDVPELPIPLRVRLTRVQHFAVASQSELLLPQQPADGRRTGAAIQLLRQRSQPRPHPLFFRTRIAGRFRSDAAQQVGDQGRIFFSTRGRPPPGSRTWPIGRWHNSSSSSSRPRRIVSGCRPVISAIRWNPPCPSRTASRAATQRRCCSSKRLSNKLSCR